MYYELYIDVFFLENFMIDSLLLLAVGHVLKCRQSYGRIIAGGIVGSLLTCLVIIIPLPAAAKLILFHVIVNSLMITTGLKITGAGQFIKAVVLLYLSAIVIGGAVQLFRPWLRYAGLLYAAFAAGYVLFFDSLAVCGIIRKTGGRRLSGYIVRRRKRKRVICFVGYRECSFRSGYGRPCKHSGSRTGRRADSHRGRSRKISLYSFPQRRGRKRHAGFQRRKNVYSSGGGMLDKKASSGNQPNGDFRRKNLSDDIESGSAGPVSSDEKTDGKRKAGGK